MISVYAGILQLINKDLYSKLAVTCFESIESAVQVYLNQRYNTDKFSVSHFTGTLTIKYRSVLISKVNILISPYETVTECANKISSIISREINEHKLLLLENLSNLDGLFNSSIVKFSLLYNKIYGCYAVGCDGTALILNETYPQLYVNQLSSILNFVNLLESVPENIRVSVLERLKDTNIPVKTLDYLIKYGNDYYMKNTLDTEYNDICNASTGEIPDKETYLKIKAKLGLLGVD